MSEYWVSTKRYWCERCKLFVKDSPLSRKDHEASPRHQHALQRFLRELHRSKEREVVAAENTKREAERLNNLGNPDYVPEPLARRAADLVPKPTTKPNTWRSEDQKKKHLDELAALGIAMPESYRKEHAMVGEWETVRVIERPATPEDGEDAGSEDGSGNNRAKRRKLGGAEDEDEEETEAKSFTVRTMEYPGDTNVSGSIGGITFKKKGSSRQVMRTQERPDQSLTSDTGSTVFEEKGAKTEPKGDEQVVNEAGESLVASGENGVLPDENPVPIKQGEDVVPKHESDEDKPTVGEPAEGGVAFKARKARNSNRRRI
ncbi:hypothetical protein DRE_02218 [Drechslerella stenobrocha 248]|uniref:U1-type domain-containing protein n=1 Tax=Drechslerella stenobrocha 248 TaxID=1043628 RepID=W7HY64_9PEZI|nr:hypothetical protein DRE_02218 [Drechslerella stenobrocha 248]